MEDIKIDSAKTLTLKFKRGDQVDYKGGSVSMFHDGGFRRKEVKPKTETFVWDFMAHDGFFAYVIEHPEGFPKKWFLAAGHFRDGFESIHSSHLKDDLFYIYVSEDELKFSKK